MPQPRRTTRSDYVFVRHAAGETPPKIGDHGQWFSAFRNLGFGFQCVLDVSELQLLIPLSIQNFDVVFEANFKLVLWS